MIRQSTSGGAAPDAATTQGVAGAPVLEARGVWRTYGSVAALADVSIDVSPGEVVGLVGDNGAGKSTLLKVLCGEIRPTTGQILVDGAAVTFHSPKQSRHLGIEVVYQDLALSTELSIAENIYLGREKRTPGPMGLLRKLDRRVMAREAGDMLRSLGVDISDCATKCRNLSGGQRQAVAVARAVMWGSKVLLLDEPTAALAVGEREKIDNLITEVARHDVGVVLVTHNIPQVHAICDRIVVLRQGRIAATFPAADVNVEDIVAWITGVADYVASRTGDSGPTAAGP
jgi:ABC-type sugar transport system ATPase subunit